MYILGNILIGLGNVLDILLSIYMWIVIIGALLSWVNPDPYNPIVRFLRGSHTQCSPGYEDGCP